VKQHPDQRWAGNLASMIQVSLVGYASAGAFLGLAYFDFFYHLVVIVVAVDNLVSAGKTSEQAGEAGLPPLSLAWALRRA
jgi:hypothetical protein